jgi:hypothetical protein
MLNVAPVLTPDFMNLLLTMNIKKHDSVQEQDSEPESQDIGVYCKIKDLSQIPTLWACKTVFGEDNNSINNKSDFEEFQYEIKASKTGNMNEWITLIGRIDDYLRHLADRDALTETITIKLISLKEIVTDLIANKNTVVATYSTQCDSITHMYTHTIRGPLICVLISALDSKGFDWKKETNLNCFPIMFDSSTYPIIRIDVDVNKSRAYPTIIIEQKQNLTSALSGTTIYDIQKLHILFNLIVNHANTLCDTTGRLKHRPINESKMEELINVHNTMNVTNVTDVTDVTDVTNISELNNLINMIDVLGLETVMNFFINTSNDHNDHNDRNMEFNPNPFANFLREKSVDLGNFLQAEVTYILDMVGWIKAMGNIDYVLKIMDIDHRMFENLFEIFHSAKDELFEYGVCTLNPDIIFEIMRTLIKLNNHDMDSSDSSDSDSNDSSESYQNFNIPSKNPYAYLTDYVLLKLFAYVNKYTTEKIESDQLCVQKNHMVCINCTKYTKKCSKTLCFAGQELIISPLVIKMIANRLIRKVSEYQEVSSDNVIDSMLDILESDLSESVVSHLHLNPVIKIESYNYDSDDELESDDELDSDNKLDSNDTVSISPIDDLELDGLKKIQNVERMIHVLQRLLRLITFDDTDPEILLVIDLILLLRTIKNQNKMCSRFDVLNNVIHRISCTNKSDDASEDILILTVLDNIEFHKCSLRIRNSTNKSNLVTLSVLTDIRILLDFVKNTSKKLNKTGHVNQYLRAGVLNILTQNISLLQLLDYNADFSEIMFKTLQSMFNRLFVDFRSSLIENENDVKFRDYYTPEDRKELIRVMNGLYSAFARIIHTHKDNKDNKDNKEDNVIIIDRKIIDLIRHFRDHKISETRYDTHSDKS